MWTTVKAPSALEIQTIPEKTRHIYLLFIFITNTRDCVGKLMEHIYLFNRQLIEKLEEIYNIYHCIALFPIIVYRSLFDRNDANI